jgi:hypothetical protein
MSEMPDTVTLYENEHGTKFHFQPLCAGGSATKVDVCEEEFLEMLEGGDCCKSCIPQPEMTDFVLDDLQIKKGDWLSSERIKVGAKCPKCRRKIMNDEEVEHTRGTYEIGIPEYDGVCPVCGHLEDD